MINAESLFLECINSPVRSIKGRVELYNGSTLLNIFKSTDRLVSFSVERVAEEGKFFGFGICQKLNVKLIDTNRELNISTANTLEAVFGVGSDYLYSFPAFKVSRVNRDENTNQLSITAYDAIYQAEKHTFRELEISTPYTIRDVASACARLLGVPFSTIGVTDKAFDTSYPEGANFEGTETIREVLDAIAEATQTIYYIDRNWRLTFRRLDKSGNALLTLDKDKYFTLDTKESRRLNSIVSATELGDNVSVVDTQSGTAQIIRDNPFWDLRDDVADLVDKAFAAVNGLTINQFECDWRGNFLLEIGDKIGLKTKDNKTLYSYVLDDVIEYDGTLSQKTQWEYGDEEDNVDSNPSSLGDALKQTYARVDKANKHIDMLVSQVDENGELISQLQLSTEGINATVAETKQQTTELIEGMNGEIEEITKRVDAAITAEDVSLQISTAIGNGVNKVETTTGFTFNEVGLTVSKSGSEMTTTITEDGMTVYRDEEAVLIADNEGVKAEDLHATTYLIVGTNSRFEDYGDNRTGCFWIG